MKILVRDIDKQFMKRAIEISIDKMRENTGGPFGCVITKNEKIVAKGWNEVTSTNDPTAHAEIQAIRKACKKLNTFQLDDCIIYSSCEPCPMCLSAIYWARPKKVFYANSREDAQQIGFDDNFIYKDLFKAPNDRKYKMQQILRDSAIKAFKEWETKSDKTKY